MPIGKDGPAKGAKRMANVRGIDAIGAPAVRRLSGQRARPFTLAEASSPPDAPSAEAITPGAPAALLAGLLAVQESLSERNRDRIAWHHGEALLEELARLQASLLVPEIGAAPSNTAILSRLAELAARIPETSDAALADALAAVALRARVELARREGAASARSIRSRKHDPCPLGSV